MGMVARIPTEMAYVADYVRRETGTEPHLPVLLDSDPECSVWRVPTSRESWLVCLGGVTNLYLEEGKPIEHVKREHLSLLLGLER